MIDHAFKFVASVVFLIGPDNRRSRRAIEKIGAVYEGIKKREGAPDHVIYRILRSSRLASMRAWLMRCTQ